MNKKVFLLLLFLPSFLFAQKPTAIDSLLLSLRSMKEDTLKVNLLHKSGLFYIDSDTTKAFFYNRKAMELSKKLHWKEGIAKSNFYLGTIYNASFNYEKALGYFNQSLLSTNKKMRSKSYQNIGGIYIYKSNYSKALAFYYKALKIDESLEDKKGIAKIAANIGSIYYGLQSYSKAIDYFNKAAISNEQIGNETDLAIVYRNLGSVYNSLKQSQKTLFYYEKANTLSKNAGNKALQARILSDIGLLYYNLNDYDKAINNCQLSLRAMAQGPEDKQGIAFNYGVLGDSFIEKAKANHNNIILLDSAISNLKKAIKLHQLLNSNRDLVYDYSSITQVYKLRGDYKSALQSFENSSIYKDSIFNSDNKETIKNLEDKRAIELRDREIKINKLQLEAKEKQKWFLILGLVLLGIIGGLLFHQSYNRRKINKKLQNLNLNLEEKNNELDQANKIKTRFFSILNHDLRSPVYNLIHFLHLQRENPELLDDATKTSIEEKTINSAENLLSSMEDMLLWSKSQMENFKTEPKIVLIESLFDDTKKHFSSEENIKIVFENLQHLELNTDENYLKTIIRNLTGNAIKAIEKVENAKIVWKAWEENEKSYLSITDNGPGGSQEQFRALYDETEVVGIKTGLGLHLIRDLAKAIDCKIEVDLKENFGTTFTLIFP